MSIRLKRINKHVFYIAGVMLAASSIVASLAWDALKVVHEDNKFERTISENNLKLLAVMQRDKVIDDVAGTSPGHYYFQTKAPGILLVADKYLKRKKYLTLKIATNKKLGSFFFSSVDSPAVEIMSANIHALISGKLEDSLSITVLPSKIFTRAVKISPDTYVLRGFDSTVKTIDQIFKKINVKTNHVRLENHISERRNDGGMTTDGELLYDRKTNLLTYIHFYSNKMLCLDTNLNLIYSGKTLGSENASGSNAMALSSTGALTSASPKRVINNASYTVNGLLFNHSRVVSKSEMGNNRNSGNTIDIYDIKTGEYKESFYIPYIKGQTINKFKIFENILIVLYRDYIATYQLSYKY